MHISIVLIITFVSSVCTSEICGKIQTAATQIGYVDGEFTKGHYRKVLVNEWTAYRKTPSCWDFFNHSHKPGIYPPWDYISFESVGTFHYGKDYGGCDEYCGTCDEAASRAILANLTSIPLPYNMSIHELVELALHDVLMQNVGWRNISSSKRNIEYGDTTLDGLHACKLWAYEPSQWWGDGFFPMCKNLEFNESCRMTPNGIDLRDFYRLDLCHLGSKLDFNYNHLCFKAYQQYICTILSSSFNEKSVMVRNTPMTMDDGKVITAVDIVTDICPESICAQTQILSECMEYGVPPYLSRIANTDTNFCVDLQRGEVCPFDDAIRAKNIDNDTNIRPVRMCYHDCSNSPCEIPDDECLSFKNESFTNNNPSTSYPSGNELKSNADHVHPYIPWQFMHFFTTDKN